MTWSRVFVLIVLLGALAACGDDDEAPSQPTATLAAAATRPPAATPSAVMAASPTTTSDEPLAAALPEVAAVAEILGIELTEREVRDDLSQAFEGVDEATVPDGVVGLYRGTNENELAIVDVARFADESAAVAFLPTDDESQTPTSGATFDLSGVGDQAHGRIIPVEDGQLALVLLRVGSLVSVIRVQCDADAELEEGTRELAAVVADSLRSLGD